jgi:integrase
VVFLRENGPDYRYVTEILASPKGIHVLPDELVLPIKKLGRSSARTNIGSRYMEPTLEKDGSRKFRLHDLRHTFGGGK